MFLISKFNSIANLSWQAQGGGPVPWLDVDMDAVEEMQITMWAASEMDTSSLSILPTNKPELPDEGILILQSVHMAL